MRVLRRVALFAVLGCSVSGCGGATGSSGAPTPGGGPSPMPGALAYLTEVNGNNETQATNILGLRLSDVLNHQPNGPTQVLQSPLVSNARSIALDAAYNTYVADQVNLAVYEFSAGSTGSDVYPIRTITSTGTFVEPRGVAVDRGGNIYVTDDLAGASGLGAIDEFSPSQSGNVQPVRAIFGSNSGLAKPLGIAVDGAGNIYAANSASSTIAVFNQSSSTPARIVSGPSTGLGTPVGVAVDSAGDVYALNQATNSVTVYSPSASGNAAPIRTIAGNLTSISSPQGIALDSSGNVWVTNLYGGAPGSVTVFAAGSNGNVAPMATYTASNSTYAFHPSGIAIVAP